MSIKDRVRGRLGIYALQEEIIILRTLIRKQTTVLTTMNSNISTLFDETDPRRKAASDLLGEQHIHRLEAEAKARKMTEEGNG